MLVFSTEIACTTHECSPLEIRSSEAQVTEHNLAATIAEQQAIEHEALFRRSRIGRTRRALRESDELVAVVEEFRVRGHSMLPRWLWDAVAQFLWRTDRTFLGALGRERSVENVGSVLFLVQQALMNRSVEEQERGTRGTIIPFPLQTRPPVLG